jgi:hypothetical protein
VIRIADVSLPSSSGPLGGVLDVHPRVEVEIERLVRLGDRMRPLFWVDDRESDAVERTLGDDDDVERVRRLTKVDARALFEIEWTPGETGFFAAVDESDADVLCAEGTADVWDVRLQFEGRRNFLRFRELCREWDLSLTLRRLYDPSLPKGDDGRMSSEQYEAVVTAFNRGYFQVPRDTSMRSLADEFGISDSAFSQRLRRGIGALVDEVIVHDRDLVKSTDRW